MRHPRVRMYGDSKFVVNQLIGIWKCKAENFTHYYEQVMCLVKQLQSICESGGFYLTHMYREYSADADSLANTAVANKQLGGSVVVNGDCLLATSFRNRVLSLLSAFAVAP